MRWPTWRGCAGCGPGFLPCARGSRAAGGDRERGRGRRQIDGTYEEAVQRAAAEGAQPGCFELADVGASGPASWVIDGYATLFSELPATFDVALVPVGVGSLGAAAARWGASVGVPVIAVEPDVAACLTASLAAGRPTPVPTPGTAMAGLDCAEVSEAAWPTLQPGIRGTITVSDAETQVAMRALAARGLRIGDSGAAPYAALERLRSDPEGAALREAVTLGARAGDRHRGSDGPGRVRRRDRVSALAADIPVRRNTLLLAGAMAVYSSVLQLVAAVSSLTFVLVTGVTGLLGLGPAIFLLASAVSAVPAGRLMDRIGRKPVVSGGYVCAAAGCSLTALATNLDSTVLVITGFALTGFANGTALQIRTAAGDMYPPERRARGISYVLFGSVFGAILGPAVFGPLFSGREVDAATLTVPWLVAAGISLVPLVLIHFVRPDPKEIAERLAVDAGEGPPEPAAPLRAILRRPGVRPAMLAALASFGVMVSVMNLSGYVVVEHHHHAQSDIFPVIGAHVLGMYALVLFVGALIDKIGRAPALGGGLLVMAVSTIGLMFFDSVFATALLLFGLGVGWNLSFVAATAQLADLTSASERGKLIGFNDLLASLLGASLALLGGYALDSMGVAALAIGATVIVVRLCCGWLPRRRAAGPRSHEYAVAPPPLSGSSPGESMSEGFSRAWRAP